MFVKNYRTLNSIDSVFSYSAPQTKNSNFGKSDKCEGLNRPVFTIQDHNSDHHHTNDEAAGATEINDRKQLNEMKLGNCS